MDGLRTIVGRLRRARKGVADDSVITVRAGVGAGLRFGARFASADYTNGGNEIPVQEAVRDLLHPGATFFDVGSNIGFFAVLAAREVGPIGTVHAFEAVPAIAEAIAANAGRNGLTNVVVHAVAVADRDDETAELMLATHPGGATLSVADAPDDLSGHLEVPLVSLDRLVADGVCPPPDVVKIDVEGAEMQVLDGMSTLLAQYQPDLICELDSADADILASKVEQWRARMAAIDYAVQDLPDSYAGSGWNVYHATARSSQRHATGSDR